MKTTKDRRKRTTRFKDKIMQNNLMQRFIREIEREEPLDIQTLETMLVFQPVKIK